MEDIWNFVKEVAEFALPHWAFGAWFIATMVMGQFMKHTVWTKQRAAAPSKYRWFWWWGYKSMVLHGALVGMCIVAPLWTDPAPGIHKLVERMAYFGLAGFMGVVGYRIIKEMALKRGIDISLPHLDEEHKKSVTPPPPEPAPEPVSDES
jgi:hypothetical protein